MSAVEADIGANLVFPAPSTPPHRHLHGDWAQDNALGHSPWLRVPTSSRGHVRSSSKASSVHSVVSAVDTTPESAYSRLSTPPSRESPSVRHHGSLLLPKIRTQDQHLHGNPSSAHPQPPTKQTSRFQCPLLAACSPESQDPIFRPAPLLCSAASFAPSCQDLPATDLDNSALPFDVGHVPCYPISCLVASSSLSDVFLARHSAYPSSQVPRAASSTILDASPSVFAATTLRHYLTSPNPAAALVRKISLPLRDPGIKNFWWDVRGVRFWDSFTSAAIDALPGVLVLLSTPISATALPLPTMSSRHPETEASLHAIYASYYLPKLNAALAISSARPLRLTAPPAKTTRSTEDLLFVANGADEEATLFGGKPSARLVGLVRSFDRFNTAMRAESNVKRVEYLSGLSALHHALRQHGCRYGFILTEIELVVVRCGTEPTPYFGDLDMTSIPLAVSAASNTDEHPLTACLALWALCQLASDGPLPPGHAHWRAETGAPAEGTRRKARPREAWMPQPQLAEKREARRSRGWVWPEDPVCRKELGKRGVRYGGL
ncbi:hypothetical protein GQ602_004704 [Ophiocordyceps camponoti-floridani]|uniref:Sialidase n=1 Tax=Ophiocordyceps camponoti-floridani TaxID=2030778 RepID=A0A8H4Q4D6_9HYPO|nr:hypothetical protein GQ602_004704 [Ophiocordyceps camponoti-floridani]